MSEKSQKLVLKQPDEPVVIFADQVRLSQVISNLMTNAAKYSDANSSITVSMWAENDDVLIRVKDRGIEIPKADLAHVFGAFYRADNEATRKEAGIGVGLYFCHLIVDHHRGEITATSEVEQGTAMTIRIPREFRAESIENISPAA